MSTEEKVFEYVDEIAANLGVAAEQVYGALLKQAVVSGVTSVMWVSVSIAVIGTLGLLISKALIAISKEDEDSMFTDRRGDFPSPLGMTLYLIGGIIVVGFTIGLGVNINNAITALLNPEYWALKEILDVLSVDK